MNPEQIRKDGSDQERSWESEPVVHGNTVVSKPVEELVSEVDEKEQSQPLERTNREKEFSRRALLQAGWVLPVIAAVGLPKSASAGSCATHSDHHNDGFPGGHHDDFHLDTGCGPTNR